ncbi:MAG: hypothetical protein G8237_15500, partial [Magnetococcales bacterium]|nr:hypothetical protein [Magnetococcales bacterium]
MHHSPIFKRLLWIGGVLLITTTHALAIEVAPRITDREIIEQLTLIKAGQEKLSQRLDDTIQNTNKRFDDVNKRFDDVNKRF